MSGNDAGQRLRSKLRTVVGAYGSGKVPLPKRDSTWQPAAGLPHRSSLPAKPT